MEPGAPGGGGRRSRMVERDIARRGVTDERVLAAMRRVPREMFVPGRLVRRAYDDRPLPIGSSQTISQPFIVALMAEAARLEPGDRVLEIGTGSGYGAAVLAEIAARVWSVERRRPLAARARSRLKQLGYDNVEVVLGDGTLGWPGAAPYDAIVVTAAGPSVPPALRSQLADGGRLVMPVGDALSNQRLIRETRHGDELGLRELGRVRFVPLVGEQGWPERDG